MYIFTRSCSLAFLPSFYPICPAPAPASLPTCNTMHAHITSLLAMHKAAMTASAKTKQQRSLKKDPSMRQHCICSENKVRECFLSSQDKRSTRCQHSLRRDNWLRPKKSFEFVPLP